MSEVSSNQQRCAYKHLPCLKAVPTWILTFSVSAARRRSLFNLNLFNGQKQKVFVFRPALNSRSFQEIIRSSEANVWVRSWKHSSEFPPPSLLVKIPKSEWSYVRTQQEIIWRIHQEDVGVLTFLRKTRPRRQVGKTTRFKSLKASEQRTSCFFTRERPTPEKVQGSVNAQGHTKCFWSPHLFRSFSSHWCCSFWSVWFELVNWLNKHELRLLIGWVHPRWQLHTLWLLTTSALQPSVCEARGLSPPPVPASCPPTPVPRLLSPPPVPAPCVSRRSEVLTLHF